MRCIAFSFAVQTLGILDTLEHFRHFRLLAFVVAVVIPVEVFADLFVAVEYDAEYFSPAETVDRTFNLFPCCLSCHHNKDNSID